MKDGYATCKLPYGHYKIKETKSPDGYNKNDTAKEFTLIFKVLIMIPMEMVLTPMKIPMNQCMDLFH